VTIWFEEIIKMPLALSFPKPPTMLLHQIAAAAFGTSHAGRSLGQVAQ
jgi:hypothetical protein